MTLFSPNFMGLPISGIENLEKVKQALKEAKDTGF
jgi:hypothetical protein